MHYHFYLMLCHATHALNYPASNPQTMGFHRQILWLYTAATVQLSFKHAGSYEHKNAISLVKGQNGPSRSAVQLAQHGIRTVP